MLIVQTAISHQLNALEQNIEISQVSNWTWFLKSYVQIFREHVRGEKKKTTPPPKTSYLGKRVHDLWQDVRVWLSADGLDEGVAHEEPHLGEVLWPSDPRTLQQQGHGLCCRHSHTWGWLRKWKTSSSPMFFHIPCFSITKAFSPELTSKIYKIQLCPQTGRLVFTKFWFIVWAFQMLKFQAKATSRFGL